MISSALIYFFKKEILNLIEKGQHFEIDTHLISQCLKQKIPIQTWEMHGFWAILGRLQPYLEANFWLLQNLQNYCGYKSQIASSAKLIPPYFIAENCQIEANAQIGPNVILGQNTVIQNNCVLKNSILYENNVIKQNCTMQNNVIAQNCHIEANGQIGNYTIIGQNCQIGINSILEDGIRIKAQTFLPANSKIQDLIF